ncbi:MAG TPA: hypothetical protein VFP50_15560 [Anaeromyxobacteraceae bacterium]|nr:hypothetical protein [Anaeromyxobacteraceae bacterium]
MKMLMVAVGLMLSGTPAEVARAQQRVTSAEQRLARAQAEYEAATRELTEARRALEVARRGPPTPECAPGHADRPYCMATEPR